MVGLPDFFVAGIFGIINQSRVFSIIFFFWEIWEVHRAILENFPLFHVNIDPEITQFFIYQNEQKNPKR
jgi:hypothetical protein